MIDNDLEGIEQKSVAYEAPIGQTSRELPHLCLRRSAPRGVSS